MKGGVAKGVILVEILGFEVWMFGDGAFECGRYVSREGNLQDSLWDIGLDIDIYVIQGDGLRSSCLV